jgi:Protein of unknown function (DUF3617)
MPTRLLAGILLVALAAFAGDKLQRMNVRTGLWESTITTNSQGQIPLPAGILDRLTPEQRARMEARMKAQPNERSRTSTEKHCVTDKDLDKGSLFTTKPNQACTEQVVSSTASSAEVHYVCEVEGIKGNGTVKIQAINAENVKGSTEIHASGNGQTTNTNSSFTAKWLGSDCGKVR